MHDWWLLIVGGLVVILRLWWVVGHQAVYKEGQRVVVTGRISAEPAVSVWSQQFSLGDFQVTAPRWPEVGYGGKVRVEGTLLRSSNFGGRSDNRGNFPGDLANSYKLKAESIKMVAEAGWAAKMRNLAGGINQRLLPEPQASLLTGIVWGGSQGLPSGLKEAVKKTGTMHVVAASGMNVTMVAGFLLCVLVVVAGRKWAVLAAVAGVWCYVVVSGGSASVVRAGIMASIMFLAQFFGRQYLGLRMLVATAIVMLVINPLWLFDLGWQLSMAATTGLLITDEVTQKSKVRPHFAPTGVGASRGEEAIKEVSWLGKLEGVFGGDFQTAVVAVVATLPIMVLGFGRISLLAPVVNALSLWVVAPLMVMGFVIFFIGMVALPLAQIVGWLAWPLLTYFVRVNEFFGSLPWGSWDGVSLPIWTGVAYYVLLVGAVAWFRRRQAA